MKNLLLLFCLVVFFCHTANPQVIEKNVDYDTAIEIAIADFLKCKLSKNHNAFSVSIFSKTEYDRYEISDDLASISILPVETIKPQYYITSVDTLGSTRLPTRYMVKGGKLFYWHDSDYGLTEEVIRIFRKYNLADYIENSELGYILGQEGYGDDFQKAAQYYFCKNNLTKYKRVITSIATGWYKPPKLKCN